MDAAPTLHDVLALVRRLSPKEQRQLVAALQQKTAGHGQPLPSLYGVWADLGPAPSAEDIAEARRAMWGSFPREEPA